MRQPCVRAVLPWCFSSEYNVDTEVEMRSRIVRIGNSQGVRIPKPFLEQTGLQEEVEIEVEGNRIILYPVTQSRAGWAEAFASMAERGDDALLDGDIPSVTSWDEDEWRWP